jgi:hypothetical protein
VGGGAGWEVAEGRGVEEGGGFTVGHGERK